MAEKMATAFTAFGKSEDLHFDENEEEFDAYFERLEQFFVANGLTYDDDKAKAVFLTVRQERRKTGGHVIDATERGTLQRGAALRRWNACKKKGHIAKACRSRLEGRKVTQTKWTKHLDVTARAEDDRDRDKGRETPAAAKDSEASLPDADGQPEDIAASPQRECSAPSEKPEHRKAGTPKTKAALGFDTEYRAGFANHDPCLTHLGTQSKPS
ncbi:unnamed protein product [Merluccius merluccius]